MVIMFVSTFWQKTVQFNLYWKTCFLHDGCPSCLRRKLELCCLPLHYFYLLSTVMLILTML